MYSGRNSCLRTNFEAFRSAKWGEGREVVGHDDLQLEAADEHTVLGLNAVTSNSLCSG